MKVLGSTEWRAFSSGCREVVHLRVHTELEETLSAGVLILAIGIKF